MKGAEKRVVVEVTRVVHMHAATARDRVANVVEIATRQELCSRGATHGGVDDYVERQVIKREGGGERERERVSMIYRDDTTETMQQQKLHENTLKHNAH